MSYHVTDLNRTIQRLRKDYGAATHLAATSRAATPADPQSRPHSRGPRRGLKTGNPGCVADAFEALNSEADQERFHEEMTAAFVCGVWFLAFLCAAGAYLAAGPFLRLIAWMAGTAI